MENGQVLEEIEIPIKDGENLKTYLGKLCGLLRISELWIKYLPRNIWV